MLSLQTAPSHHKKILALSNILGFPVVYRIGLNLITHIYLNLSDDIQIDYQYNEYEYDDKQNTYWRVLDVNKTLDMDDPILKEKEDYILTHEKEQLKGLLNYCKRWNISIPNHSEAVSKIVDITLAGNHRL